MRLLVADAHGLVSAGIRYALKDEDELEIVGEVDSTHDLLATIDQVEPEVVLLDLHFHGVDAQTLIARIRSRHEQVRVIGLAANPNEELMRSVCAHGACGVIVKTVTPGDLPATIRQIVNGTAYTATAFSSSPSGQNRPGVGLTAREEEILGAIARGLSNKQIARELFVTDQTVKFHLSNIYRKLGLTNRTEAAHWAYRHGITTDEYATA
jgi:DNA-binding NarL/FixJ family response regulator